MKLTPDQYNRTRGPALIIVVMDTIRTADEQKEQLNTRQLVKRLAAANGLTSPEHFSSLYYRVRTIVRSLADAGLIHTRVEFDKKHQVNTTIITLTPCSASPQT